MSKYIVTGGAGFIGSAIVRALLREGATKVVVLDDLSTGRAANLAEVRSQIEFRHADIRNFREIAPAMRGAEIVFHQAYFGFVRRGRNE